MRTIRLTLEYDGSRFHGWQRQSGLRTVQGELEAALATILREPVAIAGAGRTDAGVHALGQVASLTTGCALPLERIRRGANALTGSDLAVREAALAPPGFHARHSATARHYVYLLRREPSSLWATRALHLPRWPDLERLRAAVAALPGEHDFAAFSCRAEEQESTRSRLLYARWEPWPRGLALRVGAVRFLYKMMRAIVAHSLQVAYGRLDAAATADLLARPAGRATRVAPAHGLHLAQVDYDAAGGCDCPPPWPVL